MSTVGPSPALTSRVTPRSPKKWSPKSYTTGPTKRSSRAKFDNSPSDPLYRSLAYVPNASPRALIDRLSPTTTNRVHSPPKLLDRLIRSDTMITSGNDVPMEGVIENDVNNLSSRSASNNVDMTEIFFHPILPETAQDTVQETSPPISPISSTSAAAVDEILRVVPDSDQVDASMVTAVPSSPVDGQTTVQAPTSVYERCRRLILPLVMQNIRARNPKVDGAAESERLEQQVMTGMTDEYCEDTINTAKELKKQMITKMGNLEGTNGNVKSIVGVKRPREEEDRGQPSGASRTKLDSHASQPALADRPLPKGMTQDEQNEAVDRSVSMAPPSGDNILVSPTRSKNDTPLPPDLRHEISILMDPEHFKQPHTPDGRSSDYEVDRSGSRRRDGKETDYRPHSSYDMDNSERRRPGRGSGSRDADRGGRRSRYPDHDMDGSERSGRASGDHGRKQIEHHHRHSRYDGSDSEKLGRRKRQRSDEWDYVRDKEHSSPGSRNYSSSGSSRRYSHELATHSMGRELASPTGIVIRRPPSGSSCCRVPGLWFVKVGLKHMDIVEMTFEVDAEVASLCRRENGSRISVRLVCLPTASVEETYKRLDPAASQEAVTDEMRKIETLWPPKGKIIIEVNAGDNVGRSWLPRDLDPAAPPLELTEYIRVGKNNVRLLHLGDISSHTFLLYAAEAHPSLLPPQAPNSKPISTQLLVDSDWDNYINRLNAKPTKHTDIHVNTFKFAGTVTLQSLYEAV